MRSIERCLTKWFRICYLELVLTQLRMFDFAEAGGVVNDAGGKPLDFSKGRYLDLDTGIVVTNQKLMPALLKAVQESISEKASSL